MTTPAWPPPAKPSLVPSRGSAASSISSRTPQAYVPCLELMGLTVAAGVSPAGLVGDRSGLLALQGRDEALINPAPTPETSDARPQPRILDRTHITRLHSHL